MVICGVVAVGYSEASLALFLPGGVAFLLGGACAWIASRGKPKLSPTATLAGVTLAWVAASIVGAIPFWIEGILQTPASGIFEAMSGFTTTGATVLKRVEEASHGLLLWRSFMHGIGGIGIVVLLVAITPLLGRIGNQVYHAEGSELTHERLTPRIADTAKILVAVYGILNALAIAVYWALGMSFFDAVNHGISTSATAGFSTHTDSIAYFDSLAIELATVILMIIGGVNFVIYYRLVKRKSLMPQFAEVKVYLGIIAFASLLVALSLFLSGNVNDLSVAYRQALFTVTSLVTTTGFVTVDYDNWNDFARIFLLAVFFVGGCAGSTAGGMKVIRWILMSKGAWHELLHTVDPRRILTLKIGGRVYPETVRRAVFGFFFLYLITYAIAVLLVTASGVELVTALSSVAAALNTVGPGFSEVGAAESYADLPSFALGVLTACMLIGRLEVVTVLGLIAASIIRR
jgi:trk system potassium uptake protein TrkH